ncbi:MAG: Oligopeptide-binding protein OppA [Chlamydiales bacterium]|nr:Oligopeptide-binding protein OppA [Chlamydiales bacterium]
MISRFFLYCALLIVASACSHSKKIPSSQKLRLNIFTEPPTLDSRKATDSTSMNVIQMLFEGLTSIDENHTPYPAAAETITVSEDGLTYLFTLREAHWSNGDKVEAEDFVYAWQKILDPAYPSIFADKLYMIENAFEIKAGKLPIEALGVHILDERTLEVKLKHPAPYFLELTAFPTYFPVNKKVDLLNSEWAAEAGSQFACNGPFMLQKWDHENEIIVQKNPLYWDADVVRLETIQLAMIEDITTEFYMFEMNELDWWGFPLSSVSGDLISQLIEQNLADSYEALAVYYYKINTDVFPLNNINIRKALAYAINRQEIVDHVTQAKQMPALSIIPSMKGWGGSQLCFEDNDQKKAQAFLQKGLEELGLQLKDFPSLTLSYNTSREHQKTAQAIQQQWHNVLGIKIELEHCDWKVYLSKVNKQNYEIARMGWLGDYCDPISFLTPFKFRDDPLIGGQNETGWEHPDYIACLDNADHELDLDKRFEYLKQAEELFLSEMPVIPIHFIRCWYLKKPHVEGVQISRLGMANFKKAYINR